MDDKRLKEAMGLSDAGDDEGALRLFEEVRKDAKGPEEAPTVLLMEATCLLRLRRLDEAEKRLDEAESLSREPSVLARLCYSRALVYDQGEKYEDALRVLEELVSTFGAVLSSPDHRELYELVQFRRGVLLSDGSRYQEALPLLEEAISFDLSRDEKGLIYYELGLCLCHLGELERSEESFLQAISNGCAPRCTVSAHYYLGKVYSRQERHAEALRELQWVESRIQEGGIPARDLYAWLAVTFRALGRQDQARLYRSLTKQQ